MGYNTLMTKIQTSRRGFLKGLAASALTGCAGLKGGAETVRIAHLGDPQLGFCLPIDSDASYAACLERFQKMIGRTNALRPDLVVIAGDMCHHSENLTCEWPDLIRRFDAPVVVTPGNHDLGNSVTAENLARFRRVFGRDRDAVSVKGWLVIVGNSQFWRPTDLAAEREDYERWVSARLEEAKDYGGHVIGVTHIPPFDQKADEPDSYNNYPLRGRAQRLARYREAGLNLYLAGHTHRYGNRTVRGLTILNPETTCRNFDNRPFGGRLLTLHPDHSFTYEFISA